MEPRNRSVEHALPEVAQFIVGFTPLGSRARKNNPDKGNLRFIVARDCEDPPGDRRISFQFACYCGQHDKRKEAYQWLNRAIDSTSEIDIRPNVLGELELEAMWGDISEI